MADVFIADYVDWNNFYNFCVKKGGALPLLRAIKR